MSNRRKPRSQGERKVPSPAECLCCQTKGLTEYVPTVPGHILLQCCDDCLAAIVFNAVHPHELVRAEPHWHARADGKSVEPCGDHESYVTQTAVVVDHRDKDLLEEARRATHDCLLDGLGDLRCSGVWWTHYNGAEALEVVDALLPADDPDPRVQEVRAGTLEHLAASGHSVFVVAWCLARVPENQA